MVLSSSDRDDLILRVERALARAPGRVRARPEVVRAAVDRTLGALARATGHLSPGAPSMRAQAPARVTAILSAPSTPDLTSRVRRALGGGGIVAAAMASATEGRHTVVTLDVAVTDEAPVREMARVLGASLAWRGENA